MGAEAKYEQYREAWMLLRKASEIGEAESGADPPGAEELAPASPTSGLGRMEAAANYFKRYLERSNIAPPKKDEKS